MRPFARLLLLPMLAAILPQMAPAARAQVPVRPVGIADPNAFPGADPTGALPSDAAIAAALATGKTVHFPAGVYRVTKALPCAAAGDQRVYGDGNASQLLISTDFDPTAPGIVNASNSNACQMDHLRITFAQPPDLITAAASAGSGNSVVIVQPKTGAVAVGDYAYDATTPASIAHLTTVTAVSGTTVTLSASAAAIASGDSLHFAGSRAMATTLAQGCSLVPGSPPCIYPPAFYASGAGLPMGLGRPVVTDMQVDAAWNGFQITGPGGGFEIKRVNMGALNNGLSIDDLADSGTVENWKFFDFGFSSSSYAALHTQTWQDLSTSCLTPGRTDGGSFKNLQCFIGNITLMAGFTWGSFNDVNLDGTGSNFIVPATVAATSYLTITGLHAESSGTTSACLVDIGNARVLLTGAMLYGSLAQSDLCVRGGVVAAIAGYFNDFDKGYPAVLETGGSLAMTGAQIVPSAGGQQVAPIQITGGAYHLVSNVVDGTGGAWSNSTVPFISISESCAAWTSNSIEGNSAAPGHPIAGACQGFAWPNSDTANWYPGTQGGLTVPLLSTIVVPQSTSAIGGTTFVNGLMFCAYLGRHGTQTANFTDTTPTAATMVANFMAPQAGQITYLRISNQTGFTETIAGGSGVTTNGPMTIAAGSWRDFQIQLTNVTSGSEAVLFRSIGGGTN